LLVQDDFVAALFPNEITDIPSFVNRYERLKNAFTPHICILLARGISVVVDFAGATKKKRGMVSRADRTHTSRARITFCWTLPMKYATSNFGTEAAGCLLAADGPRNKDIEAVNAYFQPPSDDEKFNIVRHEHR
jgi:hypothetical protein